MLFKAHAGTARTRAPATGVAKRLDAEAPPTPHRAPLFIIYPPFSTTPDTLVWSVSIGGDHLDHNQQ